MSSGALKRSGRDIQFLKKLEIVVGQVDFARWQTPARWTLTEARHGIGGLVFGRGDGNGGLQHQTEVIAATASSRR